MFFNTFKIIKVNGQSMSPLYQSGDYLLIKKVNSNRLKAGDTIIFHHCDYGLMVKEILNIAPHKEVVLVRGINTASMTSLKIGPISYKNIMGKVIFHVGKKVAFQ